MKTQKIVLKLLVLCPVGYLLALLILDFLGFDNGIALFLTGLIGVGLAALFVFLNAQSYSQFPNMSAVDFLEREHCRVFTSNQKETLQQLDNYMKTQFNSIDLTDKQDDHGYRMYRINVTMQNAYLHVKFNGDHFELSIKPQWFSVLPDSARNYRILEKLTNDLKK